MGRVNRAEQVYDLRVREKLSWREIGRRTGLSHEGARKVYLSFMRRALKVLADA